jgi:hypothetical protein
MLDAAGLPWSRSARDLITLSTLQTRAQRRQPGADVGGCMIDNSR